MSESNGVLIETEVFVGLGSHRITSDIVTAPPVCYERCANLSELIVDVLANEHNPHSDTHEVVLCDNQEKRLVLPGLKGCGGLVASAGEPTRDGGFVNPSIIGISESRAFVDRVEASIDAHGALTPGEAAYRLKVTRNKYFAQSQRELDEQAGLASKEYNPSPQDRIDASD